MKNTARNSILILLLIATGAALWTEAILYSQNTLFQKREWIVPSLTNPLASGLITLKSRTFVAGNQLHLGAWWKNDELITRETSKPLWLSLDLRLVPNAYLDVVFNYRQNEFSAVRLFAGAREFLVYRADSGGKFLSSSHLSFHQNLSTGAHVVTLSENEGGGLSLKIDDSQPVQLRDVEFTEGATGLRVEHGRTAVRSIAIRYADRLSKFNFANRADWSVVFIKIFALLAFIAAGVFLLRGKTQLALRAARTTAAFIASLAAIWYSFDYFYWSRQPEPVLLARMALPAANPATQLFASVQSHAFQTMARLAGTEARLPDWNPKATRQKAYNHVLYENDFVWCGSGDSCAGRLAYPHNVPHDIHTFIDRPKRGRRMVFLGASQLFGMGARSLDETAFAATHRRLKRSLGSTPLESINYSLVSPTFRQMLKFYRDTLSRFAPDLVLLSRTELEYLRPPEEAAFREFLDYNRDNGIQTVILDRVLNLDCLKFNDECGVPDRSAMAYLRKIADEYGVKILDPNEWMGRQEVLNSGNLWIDEWHMTSYAQSLLAQWLSSELISELKPAIATQKRK